MYTGVETNGAQGEYDVRFRGGFVEREGFDGGVRVFGWVYGVEEGFSGDCEGGEDEGDDGAVGG